MILINGRFPVSSDIVEMDLVDHLIWLDDHFSGLTVEEVCKLAFAIAEKKNNIPHLLNKDEAMAGKKWYYAFCRRHSELALRIAQGISIARLNGFTRKNVYNLFD